MMMRLLRQLLPLPLVVVLLVLLIGSAGAEEEDKPQIITLKAAVIPNPTFLDFQYDLLERLEKFALLMDNVTLRFQLEQVQEVYGENLALLSPPNSSLCSSNNRTVRINDVTYSCDDYDMIVGPIWTNPDRYSIVDFTPPWLQTSISAIKKVNPTASSSASNNNKVTTLTQATQVQAGVCVNQRSYASMVLPKKFPHLNVVGCDTPANCQLKLSQEECCLWVSDEMILRKLQADDPTYEMTGEHLNQQLMAWPIRRALSTQVKFWMSKWIYAAISNQTVNELYFEYFTKKLCPIGTAGKHCELNCDPNHGMSNAQGKCVCESIKYTGHDCSQEVPEDLHMIPLSLKVTGFGMFAFNVGVIVICVIWLATQWRTPQVQASQPSFLLLVLLGCLISSSTILALVQEDPGDGPVSACMAIPWLYSIGFSVTFGTLFAKIRRVYNIYTQIASQVYGQTRVVSARESAYDCIICIGKVLLLDLIILVLWSILDPLQWQRYVIQEDQFGVALESQGYCVSSSWEVFAAFIATLHLSLLIVACYMCYCAKDIPTRFQEGKYVTIAMVSHIQIFIIGIPVLVLVRDDPATSFFVRSIIIWMNDLVVVTLIFGNLMRSVHLSSTGSRRSATSGGSSRRSPHHNHNGRPQKPNKNDMISPPHPAAAAAVGGRRQEMLSSETSPTAPAFDFSAIPPNHSAIRPTTNNDRDITDGSSSNLPRQYVPTFSMPPASSSLSDSFSMPPASSSLSDTNETVTLATSASDIDVMSPHQQQQVQGDESVVPASINPIHISSLSTSSQTTKTSRKSVTFSDHVVVSEYEGGEGEKEGEEDPDAKRFLPELVQGAPFKPPRPSAQDSTILQPLRKHSVYDVSEVEAVEEVISHSSSSDRFSKDLMQGAPFKPNRPGTQDGVLLQPMRKESVFEDQVVLPPVLDRATSLPNNRPQQEAVPPPPEKLERVTSLPGSTTKWLMDGSNSSPIPTQPQRRSSCDHCNTTRSSTTARPAMEVLVIPPSPQSPTSSNSSKNDPHALSAVEEATASTSGHDCKSSSEPSSLVNEEQAPTSTTPTPKESHQGRRRPDLDFASSTPSEQQRMQGAFSTLAGKPSFLETSNLSSSSTGGGESTTILLTQTEEMVTPRRTTSLNHAA